MANKFVTGARFKASKASPDGSGYATTAEKKSPKIPRGKASRRSLKTNPKGSQGGFSAPGK